MVAGDAAAVVACTIMSWELSLVFVNGAVGSEGDVAGWVSESVGAAWTVLAATGLADGAGEVVCALAMVTRPNNATAAQQKGLKRLAISMSGMKSAEGSKAESRPASPVRRVSPGDEAGFEETGKGPPGKAAISLGLPR